LPCRRNARSTCSPWWRWRISAREISGSRVLALACCWCCCSIPGRCWRPASGCPSAPWRCCSFIGGGRLGPAHWLLEWGRAQWAVTLGMLPALLALFQQFSLVSPLANALAIPLVSFVITPLALLGCLPLLDPLLFAGPLGHGLA
jgi:competence protein ComEC